MPTATRTRANLVDGTALLQQILQEVRLLRTKVDDILPQESIDDYENPEELRASIARAREDIRAGRVSDKL